MTSHRGRAIARSDYRNGPRASHTIYYSNARGDARAEIRRGTRVHKQPGWRFVAVLATVGLIAAACGGGGGKKNTSNTTGTTEAGTSTTLGDNTSTTLTGDTTPTTAAPAGG